MSAPPTFTQTRDWHHDGKSLKFVPVLGERKKHFSFLGFKSFDMLRWTSSAHKCSPSPIPAFRREKDFGWAQSTQEPELRPCWKAGWLLEGWPKPEFSIYKGLPSLPLL